MSNSTAKGLIEAGRNSLHSYTFRPFNIPPFCALTYSPKVH